MEDIIKKKIEMELEELSENYIVTITSSSEKYSQVNKVVMDYFVNKKKLNGIYVTMNKPYETLINIFEKNKINTKNVFFVDAISGMLGEEKSEAENCLVLQSPSALTEMSITISNACNSKKLNFLIMDSLSTLLVYNNEKSTVKFIHYLTAQLRKNRMDGIVLSLEKDMERKILDSIAQFCDKVVRI